ncbi:MAG: alkyl hydroperoxide reductase [Acidobacteria bacterium]|nr:alkyl hydroperoxide reductase [Acidobacteriota bacterium]
MHRGAWTLASALTALALPAAMAATAPTFSKDVAPIFFARCTGCHRPNDIAPMSLLDYKSARPWAKAIRASVLSRKMPPWFADPAYGHFANDARLSAKELTTIQAWADAGAPEGDPKDLPPKPKFVEGWQMGKPDIVIDIGEDHVVTPGEDAYDHFVVNTNFKEGKWIRAAEIKPGNRQVVHHVHVLLVQDDPKAMEVASTKNIPSLQNYLLREGKLSRIRQDAPVLNDACQEKLPDLPYLTGDQEGSLTAFLPGRQPDVFPEGTAKWIPPGAKLEFVIHYAKISGKPQTDRTSVGFYLLDGPPRRVLRRMDLRNFFMQIPAGAASHEVKRCFTFEEDRDLLSFTPHMHYRGKEAIYEVVHPDGRKETLLKIPKYDFNWQLNYRMRDPVRIAKGSRMIVTFRYDNSANNPANPDPKENVRWGDKSEEEMMTSWIEYLEVKPKRTGAASGGN